MEGEVSTAWSAATRPNLSHNSFFTTIGYTKSSAPPSSSSSFNPYQPRTSPSIPSHSSLYSDFINSSIASYSNNPTVPVDERFLSSLQQITMKTNTPSANRNNEINHQRPHLRPQSASSFSTPSAARPSSPNLFFPPSVPHSKSSALLHPRSTPSPTIAGGQPPPVVVSVSSKTNAATATATTTTGTTTTVAAAGGGAAINTMMEIYLEKAKERGTEGGKKRLGEEGLAAEGVEKEEAD